MHAEEIAWLDQPVGETTVSPTIARLAAVSQLPGYLRKRLKVPTGMHAVVAGSGNQALIHLAAGDHALGSLWQWYTGEASKMTYALLPGEPFLLLVTTRHLSGDEQVVDVQSSLRLQISQPAAFFTHFLAGKGQVTLLDLQTAVSGWLQSVLATAVADYAAADLNLPPVPGSLAQRIYQQADWLAQRGLALRGLSLPTALPAESVVALAEKQAALAERLRQVNQEEQMARLAETAELQAFARQLEADYELPGLADLLTVGEGEEGKTAVAPPQQLNAIADQIAPSRLAGQVARFRQRQAESQTETGATIIPSEPVWLRLMTPLRYVLSLVTLTLVFYSFATMDQRSPNYLQEQLKILLSAGTLLLGVVYSLWQEARTRSQLLEQQVMGSLPLLSRHDRQMADRLLRQQVLQELQGLQHKLQEARQLLFKAGQKEGVSALRDLQTFAARLQRELPQADLARAPYLTAAFVSPRELAAMLNYDEDLLRHLNKVHDETQTLIGAIYSQEPAMAGIAALAADLSEFAHRFQARARFIRMPLADS